MANPFLPDFWGYVYGFGHQPEGSIVPLAYYTLHIPIRTILDLLKIWQISLRRTLWRFVHRFGHKLGIKSKSQLTATHSAIISICDVFYVLLLKQDQQEEAVIQKRYEIYKNTATYKNATQLEHEMDGIWNSTLQRSQKPATYRRAVFQVQLQL